MSQLSDELLVAYLDGQLDTPQAQSVERMIARSKELHLRAERFRHSQTYLIKTFEILAKRSRACAPGQPPGGVRGRGQRPQRPAPQGGQAVAAPANKARTHARGTLSGLPAGRTMLWVCVISLAAAAIGYGAAQWVRAQGSPTLDKISARAPVPAGRWAQDVAHLHAYFIPESVAVDADSQSNADLIELQLSRLVNAAVPVPDFTSHKLAFRRAQVFGYRGSRMMQLSYMSDDDRLVALYVMAGGPDAQATAMSHGDVTTVSWSRDGVRYLMAGEMPETSLRALAAVAMAQIAGR